MLKIRLKRTIFGRFKLLKAGFFGFFLSILVDFYLLRDISSG
jgi:hypothetical protein